MGQADRPAQDQHACRVRLGPFVHSILSSSTMESLPGYEKIGLSSTVESSLHTLVGAALEAVQNGSKKVKLEIEVEVRARA